MIIILSIIIVFKTASKFLFFFSYFFIIFLDSKPTLAQNDLVKPSPKIRSRTRPPTSGLEQPTQNKENNEITPSVTKIASIDVKGINNEVENKTKNTTKTTVPPVPKLRKSKAKTENDSRISSEQQEAEKVRIRKKKTDPKVSVFTLNLILLITLYSRYLSENHRHSHLPLYANLIRFKIVVIWYCVVNPQLLHCVVL